MRTGIRIDRWVKERFPGLSNRHIDEAIEHQLVVGEGGMTLLKGRRIENGDKKIDTQKLSVHLERLREGNPLLQIPIVWESEDFWVVDKPAGIASHPIGLFDDKTVTHWALQKDPRLKDIFQSVQPTVTPHRLDTGTSGLLVVARSQASFRKWREHFHEKRVTKKYLAWCWGVPDREYFLNASPIAHHPSSKKRMVTVRTRHLPPIQEARTEFRVVHLLKSPERFLAEITCTTGVTHQVRVHLADLGFPLVGDQLYDPEFDTRPTKPSYHQLRAIELWGDGFRFSVESKTFGDLFKKLPV